ncbi:MAG: Fe-S-cluster containining protein [Candidatus Marinamargulisbacteria bacterium]|jgi:Fe-S-cluster containining protein
MDFKEAVYSPRGSYTSFYFFYMLYLLASKILRHKRFEKSLSDLVILELFYVGGACRHSGNCCRNLMLVKRGTDLDELAAFKRLSASDSSYLRFEPKTDGKKIKSFSCRCLSADNLCAEYDSRPTFCRNYPMSSFLELGSINDGCGYQVLQKSISPTVFDRQMIGRIEYIRKENLIGA